MKCNDSCNWISLHNRVSPSPCINAEDHKLWLWKLQQFAWPKHTWFKSNIAVIWLSPIILTILTRCVHFMEEDGEVNAEHSLRYAHCTYSYTNTMQSTHTHRVHTRPPWLIHPHLFAFYLHISPKCRWKFVVHSIRIHGSVYYMRTKACCWSSVFIWRTRHGTWKSHSSTIPDTLDFRCTVLW